MTLLYNEHFFKFQHSLEDFASQ